MTAVQINPDKLAEFENLVLHSGSHGDFESGHCAMEVVSWLADEGFTDAPVCASPVLRRYTITLNDQWDDERRQLLKPYLLRMIGTGGDGKDEPREQIAMRALFTDLLEPWYRLAGLDAQADQMASLVDASRDEQRSALYRFRDAAWAARRTIRELIKQKVLAHLASKQQPVAAAVAAAVADAAADAAAVAVADAAAAAAADAAAAAAADAAAVAVADAAAAAAADAAAAAAAVADAVADAAAAAVADAVAAAVAAAAADAAADAAAAAVADAAADAAAAAAAAAVADAVADGKYASYSTAYNAARRYFDQHPPAIGQQIAELAASQRGTALELLDRMIDPVVES